MQCAAELLSYNHSYGKGRYTVCSVGEGAYDASEKVHGRAFARHEHLAGLVEAEHGLGDGVALRAHRDCAAVRIWALFCGNGRNLVAV
jgi:hypothetical protein